MRIIFVNRCWGVFFGGAEVYDYNMAVNLKKLGCEVEVIAGKKLFGPPLEQEDGLPVHYVSTPFMRFAAQRLPLGPRQALSYTDMTVFEIGAFWRLARMRPKPDIVQINTLPQLAILLKSALGMKAVVRFPGPPRAVYNVLIRRLDGVVADGDAYDHLCKNVLADVNYIPHSLDPAFFRRRPNDVRSRLGIPADAFLLLFAGRLAPLKDIPFLVKGFYEALRQDKNLRLLVVGSGSCESLLHDTIRELDIGEAVLHVDGVNQETLLDYYSCADAFVLPSLYDNFPAVLLEAMSCELPVIATRVGGIPKLVTDGENGFLIKSGQMDQYAAAVRRLAQEPALRENMGKRNRQKVLDHWTWTESATKMLALYERILAQGTTTKGFSR